MGEIALVCVTMVVCCLILVDGLKKPIPPAPRSWKDDAKTHAFIVAANGGWDDKDLTTLLERIDRA